MHTEKKRRTHFQPLDITVTWLVHLRWGAIGGQVILIYLVSLFFKQETPVLIISLILGFELLSNLLFLFLRRQQKVIPGWLVGGVMFIDITLLTTLLYLTGGAMNPFTFLYLLHIVIVSILMPPRWAWGLAIFTIFCYANFFLPVTQWPVIKTMVPAALQPAEEPAPAPNAHQHMHHAQQGQTEKEESQLQLHLQGMLVAFAVTTLFTVFFIGKIQQNLQHYNQTKKQLADEKARNEKLAALATLAAGAAHEFSTPLATISVAVGEMLHTATAQQLDTALVDDAFLIRNQVEICKEILEHLAADSGAQRGEPHHRFTIPVLIEEIEMALPEERAKRVCWLNQVAADQTFFGPLRSLTRVLKGLLNNGFDASQPKNGVTLQIATDQHTLSFLVNDHGSGIREEDQARVGEPFFTTKPPGKGMGLGLFLARALAERFGGYLTLNSTTTQGTTALFTMDIKQLQGGKDDHHSLSG